MSGVESVDAAGIAVAGAPVSFGVFELTPVSLDVTLPTAEQIAAVLGDSGYTGIDLGPLGFLGRSERLRQLLSRHSLALAGGWIELPFSDDAAFRAALPALEVALDVFRGALPAANGRPPKPTLADAGDAVRKANPGGGAGHALDREGWARFARNVALAVERVRDRGLEPTFHHHACTFVETPDEIDELLDRTDVGLTLDTGHLLIGGGDPLDGWRRWASRVNHLHVKDVRVPVLRDIIARSGGMIDVWSGGTFVALGDGDLDIDGFMTAVVESRFDGWLVIEQDVYPQTGYDFDAIVADHVANRDVLRRWIP